MENQNQNPMNVAQAPVSLSPAHEMVKIQAPAVLPELPKPKKSHVALLLAVFALMAATVGYVAVNSPDLLTSMLVGQKTESVHASAPASNVYTKGEWARAYLPEVVLKNSVPEKIVK
ncbi:hypothetical protein HZA44_02600 [Candidatus Peregrinibacteria bacterium]|nr:hypothetical protein [Candidatus Peregrinibacteria bacterium]